MYQFWGDFIDWLFSVFMNSFLTSLHDILWLNAKIYEFYIMEYCLFWISSLFIPMSKSPVSIFLYIVCKILLFNSISKITAWLPQYHLLRFLQFLCVFCLILSAFQTTLYIASRTHACALYTMCLYPGLLGAINHNHN